MRPRWLIVGLCTLLAGCASQPLKIIADTPASVEIECWMGQECPQKMADLAQSRCKAYGKNAVPSMVAGSPSGNRRTIFRCVE